MTPEEAIKIAIHCFGVQAEQEVCEECPVYLESGIACREVARVAISALEEIQQYREVGTVEQVKTRKKTSMLHIRLSVTMNSMEQLRNLRWHRDICVWSKLMEQLDR